MLCAVAWSCCCCSCSSSLSDNNNNSAGENERVQRTEHSGRSESRCERIMTRPFFLNKKLLLLLCIFASAAASTAVYSGIFRTYSINILLEEQARRGLDRGIRRLRRSTCSSRASRNNKLIRKLQRRRRCLALIIVVVPIPNLNSPRCDDLLIATSGS